MYNYEEIKEAIRAFLRMGYGDSKGENFEDSLAEAIKYLSGNGTSFGLFARLLKEDDIMYKLNALGHLEEKFEG